MLELYDSGHEQIGKLIKYKDCKKESEVTTGDATLSFTYLAWTFDIRNEYYVRTKDAEYTIKEVNEDSDGFPQIVAVLNLEDLQRESWESYSISGSTIAEAAQPLLERVGWSVGECSITKRRNAAMIQVTTLGIIQNLCTAFMCEPVFDNIRKTVSFYEERGEDKGVYFMQGLNLRKLDKQNNSYDYYTQIIPIGADGLTIESINGGKKYLENYQYSNKILPYIWKDESYTDAQALMEDAELKLKDLSRPATSYAADVIDLAKQSSKYGILSYSLGDRVTLIDRRTGTREKQRILKITEYEQEPEKNSCELGNTVLTFEELQERLQAAADIVSNTMTSDGKIHVSDILGWNGQALDQVIDRVGRVTAVSYNNAAPVDAETGDVWFDTDNGNMPHRYDGESWQEEQFGGEALKVKSVTADRIDIEDLFAQDIMATGAIRGATIETTKGSIANIFIEDEGLRAYWVLGTSVDEDGTETPIYDETSYMAINNLHGIYTGLADPDWMCINANGESKFYVTRYGNAGVGGIAPLTGWGSTGDIGVMQMPGVVLQQFENICSETFYENKISLADKYAPLSVSDKRLKCNITPALVDALPIIDRIGLYAFDWLADGRHQKIGFIADYLEKIDPALMRGGEYDENGNRKVKSVDTFYLLAYVVKAIQELHDIVRQQDERIKELCKEVQSIKGEVRE